MQKHDLKEPLGQFQATLLTKGDMFELIKCLNNFLGDLKVPETILQEEFEEKWPRFEKRVNERLSEVKLTSSLTLPGILDALTTSGLPEPSIGTTANFLEGFESHSLYTAITSVAKKRLYIFGRKNRKLFDKEHGDFFTRLRDLQQQGQCFDFRVLFLSPEAPSEVITTAHADEDFQQQLNDCLKNACRVLDKYGITASEHCRMYGQQRTTPLMVVDDAILFAQLEFTPDGKTMPVTKSPFTITEADSVIGRKLLKAFITTWEEGTPLTAGMFT
jgi:hypothetical protein